MRSMFAVANFRGVCSRLANFERTFWSTQRHHEFFETHEELDTGADCDKFVHSFEDNYLETCNGRSIWMIDCGKFDPDSNMSLRRHLGRNPRMMSSMMESRNYHELHSRLYVSILLKPKHCDHDLPEWTSSFCCER